MCPQFPVRSLWFESCSCFQVAITGRSTTAPTIRPVTGLRSSWYRTGFSAGGVRPTVDQVSLDPQRLGDNGKAADLRSYLDSIDAELARPMAVEKIAGNASAYDAIYIPGGHGPMEDLFRCAPLGEIITELHDAGRVVTSVCHGPAGLLPANRQDGRWLFQGRRMTAFTNEEERLAGLAPRAPWLLEDRLQEQGAVFRAGPPWQSHVVADGNLITGQNPASSRAATERTLAELEVRT